MAHGRVLRNRKRLGMSLKEEEAGSAEKRGVREK